MSQLPSFIKKYVCDPIFIKNNIEELSFRPYFKVSDLHELLIAVDVGLFEPLLQKFDFFKTNHILDLQTIFWLWSNQELINLYPHYITRRPTDYVTNGPI